KEEVEILLDQASPAERELLYLSAVEEYSIQEIAEITQTPKGTLLSRLHRLKNKIRDQFGKLRKGEVG
ncbi:MAG: RNA polymerase sigma-70 factor (ECF subfamily), partial [bacterium]